MQAAYPKLHKAIRYAVKKHRGTDRDGEHAVPYVCHPVEVMLLLRWEAGVVEERVLCAAMLHDLVEDTDVELGDIKSRFGKDVAALVAEVTRRAPSDEETRGLSPDEIWELRNTELMAEIKAMSHEARLIKLADRFSNIRESLRTRSGAKLDRYVRQTRQILEAIPRDTCPQLWDAIARCVHETA